MKRLLVSVLVLTFAFLLRVPVWAADAPSTEYTIGIDDVLDISVIQPEKLDVTVTVSPDGSITFPYIGNLQVKGATMAKVQEEIQMGLANGYMKYPIVAISLKESRSRKFSVTGDVLRPGMYAIDEDTTVLKAISIAGGFVRYGPASQVRVIRPLKDGQASQAIVVDVKKAVNGDSSQNVTVQPGDVIEVTEGKFSVSGDVNKPGIYPMEDGTTVLKAISIAGGFIRYGPASRVRVLRPRKGEFGRDTTIKVDIRDITSGDTSQNLLIQPGDVIEVTEGKYSTSGDVIRPGSYPMEENVTVLKAISNAGGFLHYGPASDVRVLRPKSGDSGYEIIKVYMKDIIRGDSAKDLVIQPGDTIEVTEGRFSVAGDVLKPGTYPIEENTTVLKAISLAGGFGKYGAASLVKLRRPKKDNIGHETIKVNIVAIIRGDSAADMMILPGDIIEVTEGKFSVYGEVMRPGMYSIAEPTTVTKAISIAGGFTKFGSASRVKILRERMDKDGYDTLKVNVAKVMNGSSKDDIILLPGDTVVVNEGIF